MSCRVYLGRLPYGTRERDVDKFFRGFGKLREINLKNGYGFVVRCKNICSLLFYICLICECSSVIGMCRLFLRAHGRKREA